MFVGLGKREYSDDAVGIELALRLKEKGVRDVYLNSEAAEIESSNGDNTGRPIIFLDALNFGTEPGKITLMPLQTVFWNSTLSHRLSAFISGKISPKRLEKSYLLFEFFIIPLLFFCLGSG